MDYPLKFNVYFNFIFKKDNHMLLKMLCRSHDIGLKLFLSNYEWVKSQSKINQIITKFNI